MRTSLVLTAALALLHPIAARAGDAPQPPVTVDARAVALAGAFSGLGTRTDSGATARLGAWVTPALHAGELELRLPLRAAHTQTWGASLDETDLAAFVNPEWRASKALKLGAEGGVIRVSRPGWPDQYQRQADGVLPPTDRYSYRAWRAGANVYARPAAHQHLRLRWRVTSYTYTRDPNFDPTSPAGLVHLTARDNVQHEADASWRYLREAWAFAARLDTSFRRDSVYPARHALTGSTLNPTPTPHQSLNRYEPSAEVELRALPGGVKLSLSFGWAIQDDTYEGYYSYAGPHPRAAIEWAASERATFAAGAQAWWLTYGPNSRDPNGTHPNTDGQRLWDHKLEAEATFRYKLWKGLSMLAEGSYRWRRTNYPDYVPGVFPASRFDQIRWDYENWRAVGGVEAQL